MVETTPDAEALREQLARVIDPSAFESQPFSPDPCEDRIEALEHAHAKAMGMADAILALIRAEPLRGVAAEFRALHEAARGCEFDLTPADGPIAQLTLFVHQHGDALIAALTRAPVQPSQGEAAYEVLPTIYEDDYPESSVRLIASYTANNGIRIHIADDGNQSWQEFDFTDKQARLIGSALPRWSGVSLAAPSQGDCAGVERMKALIRDMAALPLECYGPGEAAGQWQREAREIAALDRLPAAQGEGA